VAAHDMSEYISVFLLDMEEHLQSLEESLLSMEKLGADKELVSTVFRAAHSLKGSSAAMGFEKVTLLTHRMEDILDKIRNHQLHIDQNVMDILFHCLDMLSLMKQSIERQEALDSIVTGPLIEQMELLLEIKPPEGLDNREGSATERLTAAVDRDRLVQLEQQGFKTYSIHVTLRKEAELKSARFCVILQALDEIGEVIGTYPDLKDASEDVSELQILFVSRQTEGEIELNALSDSEIAAKAITDSALPESKGKTEVHPPSGSDKTISPQADKKTTTVRIDVERLELLMNTLSELVIYQTRNVQINKDLTNRYHGDGLVDDLTENTSTMSKVIGELQEHVIKTRMQPIETLFNRIPRMIRDLSQALQKEVELVLEGGETELDRTVLEEIGDPLIHILRNSLDHGIEDKELRKQRNKPVKGTISVRAIQQENHVTLTISDDGGGIDPAKLKKSAMDKKIISEAEAEHLTHQQAIQLIFAPGFSTAKQVTDISGRGMGMDIVKTHIEKINGIIDIHSEVGKGTDFHIRLPLTMAIIRGILFKMGHRIFALPMSNVLEIVNLERAHIEQAAGKDVFRYRDFFIPIRWIEDDFHFSRSTDKTMKMIVIGVSDKRFAIPVSELIGFQDIVVKPISDRVEKKDIVSNATILGNGNVALILDAAGMYKTLL
jgi:two-component system, chemotaxis family, sensor kinase CheA